MFFHFRSKCEDEDEDAIAMEEIQEMFPSYSESDFAEFKPVSLEQVPVKKSQKTDTNKIKHLISNEDVSLVYEWHSSFVRTMTSAEWLPSKKKLVDNEVINSFLQRYPTFSRVTYNAWEALDAEHEGILLPSMMVLISQIKAKINGNGMLIVFFYCVFCKQPSARSPPRSLVTPSGINN